MIAAAALLLSIVLLLWLQNADACVIHETNFLKSTLKMQKASLEGHTPEPARSLISPIEFGARPWAACSARRHRTVLSNMFKCNSAAEQRAALHQAQCHLSPGTDNPFATNELIAPKPTITDSVHETANCRALEQLMQGGSDERGSLALYPPALDRSSCFNS
jgi:hypothetical protein